MPTAKSNLYRSPATLTSDGTVHAACLAPDGRLGMMASKHFAGFAPTGWKVVSVDSQENDSPATNAIDDNPDSIWQTRLSGDPVLPHQLTIDMGSSHRIGCFTYLPRQDGNRNCVIESYRFETSVDGQNWRTNVDSKSFGNIRNNP